MFERPLATVSIPTPHLTAADLEAIRRASLLAQCTLVRDANHAAARGEIDRSNALFDCAHALGTALLPLFGGRKPQ